MCRVRYLAIAFPVFIIPPRHHISFVHEVHVRVTRVRFWLRPSTRQTGGPSMISLLLPRRIYETSMPWPG